MVPLEEAVRIALRRVVGAYVYFTYYKMILKPLSQPEKEVRW